MISRKDPKKRTQKGKNYIFANTTEYIRVNNSVYHTKIIISINADHCSMVKDLGYFLAIITEKDILGTFGPKKGRFGCQISNNIVPMREGNC